jgi:DNA-binding CsgD family transcriptional regulator
MRGEDSDILIDLYRGAGQVPPWQGFLRRLGDRARAVLLILPEGAKPQDIQIFSSGPPNLPPDLPIASDALLRLRYQRVYAAEELAGPRAFAFARIVRVRLEGGGDAWLIVGRDSAEFSAAFTVMISGMAPHLGVAAGNYLAQSASREQTALSDRLADKVQTGVLTLNAAGLILTASPFAQQLLAKGAPLFGQIGARLGLPPLAAKILGEKLNDYQTGLDQVAVALQLAPLQVLIQPYSGADHARQNPAALVHLRLIPRPSAAGAATLAKMVQITLSEARFALKLADGLTIAEAGAAQGLTLETARNYSKQIYSKMGLRGQSDLIRFVQNSVIPLI